MTDKEKHELVSIARSYRNVINERRELFLHETELRKNGRQDEANAIEKARLETKDRFWRLENQLASRIFPDREFIRVDNVIYMANSENTVSILHLDNIPELGEYTKPMKKILAIDFDGVIHSYTSGWQGNDVIPDPPTDGVNEFLISVVDKYQVVVVSSRFNDSRDCLKAMNAVHSWFNKNRLLDDKEYMVYKWTSWHNLDDYEIDDASIIFCAGRPPAYMTIDDRSFMFRGVWPTLEEIENFHN